MSRREPGPRRRNPRPGARPSARRSSSARICDCRPRPTSARPPTASGPRCGSWPRSTSRRSARPTGGRARCLSRFKATSGRGRGGVWVGLDRRVKLEPSARGRRAGVARAHLGRRAAARCLPGAPQAPRARRRPRGDAHPPLRGRPAEGAALRHADRDRRAAARRERRAEPRSRRVTLVRHGHGPLALRAARAARRGREPARSAGGRRARRPARRGRPRGARRATGRRHGGRRRAPRAGDRLRPRRRRRRDATCCGSRRATSAPARPARTKRRWCSERRRLDSAGREDGGLLRSHVCGRDAGFRAPAQIPAAGLPHGLLPQVRSQRR